MINISNNHLKTHAQKVAVCMFNKSTSKVDYENYEHYYKRNNRNNGKI